MRRAVRVRGINSINTTHTRVIGGGIIAVDAVRLSFPGFPGFAGRALACRAGGLVNALFSAPITLPLASGALRLVFVELGLLFKRPITETALEDGLFFLPILLVIFRVAG